MTTEAKRASKMATLYDQHGALALDRPARLNLLHRLLKEVEAEIEASPPSDCVECRKGKFCWPHLESSIEQRARSYRCHIRAEEADQAYADNARKHSVRGQDHKHSRNQYWQNLRYRRMYLCGRKCEAPGCSSPSLDCHHLHYDTLGFEEIDDVRMLCRECHDAQHGTFKPTRPQGFYVKYLNGLAEKRRAAGIPDPPLTHDDRYWDERRRWNDQKSAVAST
jgi:hypothetical protein